MQENPSKAHKKNTGRLFIEFLSALGHKDLCFGLEMLENSILQSTSADVYVFSLDNSAKGHVQRECSSALTRGTLTFQSLGEGWYTPKEASNASEWHFQRFPEDYRRMGHWRLSYPLELARSLGYKWVLQIDTDSWVRDPMQTNLVEELNRLDVDMAGRFMGTDVPTWGLPELTRYFLVTEQIVPATLFEHCSPPSIDGLYTLSSKAFPGDVRGGRDLQNGLLAPEHGGWDRTVISGNLVVINTEFWFRRDVQKYLRLVLGTGGHFRFRWNEQAVMGMIWQIFIPPERFHMFTFDYTHG